MTTLFVDNLKLHGHHGVTPEERKSGTPLRFRITAQIRESASQSDAIDETVDYAAIAAIARRVNEKNSFHTLEHLAARIAGECLRELAGIVSLEVEIVKYEGFEAEFGVKVTAP